MLTRNEIETKTMTIVLAKNLSSSFMEDIVPDFISESIEDGVFFKVDTLREVLEDALLNTEVLVEIEAIVKEMDARLSDYLLIKF